MQEKTTNQHKRIQDLEGQLLSVYYAHQQQKEFEAEEVKEEESRKRRIQKQMVDDAELAKRFERGSGGLSAETVGVVGETSEESGGGSGGGRGGGSGGGSGGSGDGGNESILIVPVRTVSAASSPLRGSGGSSETGGSGGRVKLPPSSQEGQEQKQVPPSTNPFENLPPLPPITKSPTEQTTQPSQPSQPSQQHHERQLTDHEFALKLHQEDRRQMQEQQQQQYSSPANTRHYSTPTSNHSNHSNNSNRSNRSNHSNHSNHSSQSRSSNRSPSLSPFLNMHEGQSIVLNSLPAMFHRCKVRLGLFQGSHSRYLIVHSSELIILKPNKEMADDARSGTACIFKVSHSLHGIRARINRKQALHVDVVDPDGKTTYEFATEDKALKFVRDIELNLP